MRLVTNRGDSGARAGMLIDDGLLDAGTPLGLEHIALVSIGGYTLLNDLSTRDLQFATPQWMRGKVFDGSAPCGPALVTPDEAERPTRSRSRST